jgi:hypothetical protein
MTMWRPTSRRTGMLPLISRTRGEAREFESNEKAPRELHSVPSSNDRGESPQRTTVKGAAGLAAQACISPPRAHKRFREPLLNTLTKKRLRRRPGVSLGRS